MGPCIDCLDHVNLVYNKQMLFMGDNNGDDIYIYIKISDGALRCFGQEGMLGAEVLNALWMLVV